MDDANPPEFVALGCSHAGELIGVRVAPGGNSSASAALAEYERGTFFVKGVPNQPGGPRDSLVRERLINPAVVPLSPAIQWSAEDDGWLAVGFEVIDGRGSDFTPGSGDLPEIVDILNRINAIDLPEVAADWHETRWDRYLKDKDDVALLRGDVLLYTDVHEYNLLIGAECSWAVDWSWPTRGAAFIDPACFVVQLIAAGHTPEAAEGWAAETNAWQNADPRAIDAFASASLRMHAKAADRRPEEAWLRAMEAAVRSWTEYRSIPRPRPVT